MSAQSSQPQRHHASEACAKNDSPQGSSQSNALHRRHWLPKTGDDWGERELKVTCARQVSRDTVQELDIPFDAGLKYTAPKALVKVLDLLNADLDTTDAAAVEIFLLRLSDSGDIGTRLAALYRAIYEMKYGPGKLVSFEAYIGSRLGMFGSTIRSVVVPKQFDKLAATFCPSPVIKAVRFAQRSFYLLLCLAIGLTRVISGAVTSILATIIPTFVFSLATRNLHESLHMHQSRASTKSSLENENLSVTGNDLAPALLAVLSEIYSEHLLEEDQAPRLVADPAGLVESIGQKQRPPCEFFGPRRRDCTVQGAPGFCTRLARQTILSIKSPSRLTRGLDDPKAFAQDFAQLFSAAIAKISINLQCPDNPIYRTSLMVSIDNGRAHLHKFTFKETYWRFFVKQFPRSDAEEALVYCTRVGYDLLRPCHLRELIGLLDHWVWQAHMLTGKPHSLFSGCPGAASCMMQIVLHEKFPANEQVS